MAHGSGMSYFLILKDVSRQDVLKETLRRGHKWSNALCFPTKYIYDQKYTDELDIDRSLGKVVI